jgi:serine/threonine protein kinase
VHQVGAGVLGPVFRGYDPEQDRAVAIKAFVLDLTPEQARDLADDLGRLPTLSLKHPSIIAPYAAGADGSTAYLVQEYFVAESADVALKQYGPAPVPDAMRLIGQLAGALDFAAAAGVHHGALHPRDILVAPHEVRLSGLGVVEALERVGYRTSVRRPYAAPERAAGIPFGSQADVFSLAGVSYELLTGRRPSPSGESVAVESDTIQSADPAALSEAFARALSARPDDRHGSALAFAAALKHALTGEPLVAGDAVERPKTRRAPRAGGRKAPAESKEAAVPEAPPVTSSDPLVVAPEPVPVEAELLPAAPPPGSTPLPVFLEAYQPGPEPVESGTGSEPDQPTPAGQAALPGAGAAEPLDQELTLVQDALFEDAVRRPKEALDFDELDRRTEMTTAVAVAVPGHEPMLRDVEEPAPEPSAEEPAPEETFHLVQEPARPADEADGRAEPTPADSRVGDHPEPANQPPREAAMLGSEPPVVPSNEARPETTLMQKLGLLLVGILIGFLLGYFVAPRGAPAAAAHGAAAVPAEPSAASQPPAAVPTPGAASVQQPPATAAPAQQPLQTAETAPEQRPPASPPPVAKETAVSVPVVEASKTAKKPAPKAAAPARTKPQAASSAAGTATGQAAAPAAKKPAASRAAFEGSLVVASKPNGATVQLDGRPVGTTPLTMQAVAAGAHAIRLELAGYQIWSASVQVNAGKVNRVTASLERRPGG